MKLRYMIMGLLIVGAAGAIAVSQLKAEEKTQGKTAQIPPDAPIAWVKRCQDIPQEGKKPGRYCEAVQQLSISQKEGEEAHQQRLAELAFGYPPGSDGELQGVLVLPLGILVQPEIRLDVDGEKAMSFPVRYCDNGGCYATISVKKSVLEKMRAGAEIDINTQAATGQPVLITLSLKGFTDVIEEIKPQS